MTDKPIYDPSLIFRSKAKRIINKVLTYLVLIIVALSVLLPLYIVLITSLKGKSEAMDSSFSWWPSEIDLHGYKEVFTYTSGSEDSVSMYTPKTVNSLPTCTTESQVTSLGKQMYRWICSTNSRLPKMVSMWKFSFRTPQSDLRKNRKQSICCRNI